MKLAEKIVCFYDIGTGWDIQDSATMQGRAVTRRGVPANALSEEILVMFQASPRCNLVLQPALATTTRLCTTKRYMMWAAREPSSSRFFSAA